MRRSFQASHFHLCRRPTVPPFTKPLFPSSKSPRLRDRSRGLGKTILPYHNGSKLLNVRGFAQDSHGEGHSAIRGHAHGEAHGAHGHSHGHSHGHGQGHDHHVHLLGGCHDQSHSTDLAEMKGEAMRVALLGLGCNLFLGGLQLFSGNYCNSAALTSDAWHTLTDSFADLITLGVVQLTLKPPGANFPFGRGKLDSLAALGVSGIMVTTGISTMRMSATLLSEALGVESMQDHGEDGHHGHEDHGHSHLHIHSHGSENLMQDGHVNAVAVGACLLTIASKEALYRITRRAAERLNSSVLLANAWHHRSDAMSSGFVLVGVLCRVFVHSAFDPVAGAFLSSIILRISWGIGRRAIGELLDMQMPKADLQPLENALLQALEARHDLRLAHLKGRRAGPEVHLEAILDQLPGHHGQMTAEELMQLEKSLLSELHLGGHRTVWSLRAVINV